MSPLFTLTPFQLCLQNTSRIPLLCSFSTAANLVQTFLFSLLDYLPSLSSLLPRAHSGFTLSQSLCAGGFLFLECSSHLILGPCSTLTCSPEAFPEHLLYLTAVLTPTRSSLSFFSALLLFKALSIHTRYIYFLVVTVDHQSLPQNVSCIAVGIFTQFVHLS